MSNYHERWGTDRGRKIKMMTRTQFQKETGLTRKALRVYEDKGLLEPLGDARWQAMYRRKDVDRAVLIRRLRQAGIALTQIQAYLQPASVQDLCEEDAAAQLRTALETVARNAIEALDHLDIYTRNADREIRRLHHGGNWAWGRSAEVSKSQVCDYVSDFARTLGRAGVPSHRIAARYENERSDRVDITCYTETDSGDMLHARNGKRLFVPEDIYLAMRTTGLSGQYDCFDASYAALKTRKAAGGGDAPRAPVEIYLDYPQNGVHHQPFDAFVMV